MLLVVNDFYSFIFLKQTQKPYTAKKQLSIKRTKYLLLIHTRAAEDFCAGYWESFHTADVNHSANAGWCGILTVHCVALQGSFGPSVFLWRK